MLPALCTPHCAFKRWQYSRHNANLKLLHYSDDSGITCGDPPIFEAVVAENVQCQRLTALILFSSSRGRMYESATKFGHRFFHHHCLILGHIDQSGGRNVGFCSVHLSANRGAGAIL